MDQNVIQTYPKSGIATGEAAHVECRVSSGLWSLLRIRWRSKKLDKTSGLVRIRHRIFRSLRGRQRVLSSVRV
jgi:hypothetical protein